MPLVAALTLGIEICFIIHAYRSGAPRYWVFVILMFPIAGCIAYYFMEVFPVSREAHAARKAARKVSRALDPDRDLRARLAAVQECGSMDNRLALGEECLERGMHAEAVRLYESCREGAWAGDPVVLFGLARAHLEGGDHAQAKQTLELLARTDVRFRTQEVALLQARALDGLGESEAALAAYRALLPTYSGFEARFRYALLLERLGRGNEAQAAFGAILTQAQRNPPALDAERNWAALARKHCITS